MDQASPSVRERNSMNLEPSKPDVRLLVFTFAFVASMLTLAALLDASDALVSAILMGTAAVLVALRPRNRL